MGSSHRRRLNNIYVCKLDFFKNMINDFIFGLIQFMLGETGFMSIGQYCSNKLLNFIVVHSVIFVVLDFIFWAITSLSVVGAL